MTECLTQEFVYATVGVDESPDWSGGAVSTVSYYNNCWFGWTVPRQSRGVVVGFNELDSGPYWQEIDFGFRFKDGQYKFIEFGELIDPTTPYTTYQENDRFYVFRVDNDVLYIIRPATALIDDLYFDPRYPTYRFPGPIVRVSPAQSFGEVFLDASFWAYNDTVDNERSGDTWTTYSAELNPDNIYVYGTTHLIANSGSIYGALPLSTRGADSLIGTNSGAIDGSLVLLVSGSGSTVQGMELALPIKVVAFDYSVESYVLGELPLTARGGTYMTGDTHQGIRGYLPITGRGRGYSGSTAILGELPAPVISATTSKRTDPMQSLIMGQLPLAIAATGTEDGQTRYKTWLTGELPLVGAAIGGDIIGTPATAGVMALSLPLDANGSGTGSRGVINAFLDLELPAPTLWALTSAEQKNEFFILLAFTGDVVTEPPIVPGFSIEVAETFYALTAPLRVHYSSQLMSRMTILSQTQTFQQLAADITEAAISMTRMRGDLITQVAEAYGVTENITVSQALAVAEQLVAAGAVESLYHGMAAIVAAVTITDSKINAGAGSSGGGTGGETTVIGTGEQGNPAELVFTGYFPAGTIITIDYTSTIPGGPGGVYYVVPDNATAEELVSQLADYINSLGSDIVAAAAGGTLEIEPANIADTITIISVTITFPEGSGTGQENSGLVGAYSRSLTSSMTVADLNQQMIHRMAAILDLITANSLLSNTLTIVVNELASVEAGDSMELTRQLLADLMDEVDLYALVKTPPELVQGWVMNTEGSMPISEYDNFTFNSMTQFKDKFYGTTDAGLYMMGADTDDSAPITAELSSLMLDLGSSRMKRIRSAYLGYTASNQLVLKVRAVSDGQLSEHWYKARPVAIADAPREGYVRVGQGLRSRYWQFELTNVGGGDFEIDQLELYPLFLNRRV